MVRLRDRKKQIPGGLKFRQPETRFTTAPWITFDQIVRSVMAHRMANPNMAKQHGWVTDYVSVANEVDAFNAEVCRQGNFLEYIEEGGPDISPPISNPLHHPRQGVAAVVEGAKKLGAGIQILVEWIESREEAVSIEHAEARAAVCADCPQNSTGGLTDFFTEPVSHAIKKELERRMGMDLKTSRDDVLNVCRACLCPLHLKVHVPLRLIRKRLEKSVINKLPANCWILKELKENPE